MSGFYLACALGSNKLPFPHAFLQKVASLSLSEPAPLDPLRVSPQVFSSALTFVLTLLSPFGSVSNSTATFFSRV